MIPLASDLLPFPGQMQREDHLKSASLPDRAFFIWPQHNAVLNSRKCPEVIVVPVDKIAHCCKRVTERAIAQRPESACSASQGRWYRNKSLKMKMRSSAM